MDYDVKHLKFKVPFTCFINGPTYSGKTHLTIDVLRNHRIVFYNSHKEILNVLWVYGQWNNVYKVPIDKTVNVQYISHMPKSEYFETNSPDIIIIDDFLHEFDKKNNKSIENFFLNQSHNLNISVIFTSQNLFFKNLLNINRNSQYFLLLKNLRGTDQIRRFAIQTFGSDYKRFMEAYYDATKIPYGYLLVDLRSDTPDNLRLRTRILPEESPSKTFSPIIYMPI